MSQNSFGFSIASYFMPEANQRLNELSKFELAANSLGFKPEQHEALLKNFQLAGYFKPIRIWEDLNRIGMIESPVMAFKELFRVIKDSNADQDDPQKFNTEYMRKNLFNSNCFDMHDSIDLIVYMTQHAYNRRPGQERNELESEDWMIKYKTLYIEQARILGLIDRKTPTKPTYDFVWIAGAVRPVFLSRIIDFYFNWNKYNFEILGEILLLAGNRELWIGADSINPVYHKQLLEAFKENKNIDSIAYLENDNLVDGIEYIKNLAKKINIKLNPLAPVIEYKQENECPHGRFTKRIYPNYDLNEQLKITETLMAKDFMETELENKFFVKYIDTIECIGRRPTTATTARDATKACVEQIFNNQLFSNRKEFSILFASNNPYIERQTLTSQQEADQVLRSRDLDKQGYKFEIEGIGYACKNVDVAGIHSEFGALVAEKWKLAMKNEKVTKRDIKDLLFQWRDNSSRVSDVPNYV